MEVNIGRHSEDVLDDIQYDLEEHEDIEEDEDIDELEDTDTAALVLRGNPWMYNYATYRSRRHVLHPSTYHGGETDPVQETHLNHAPNAVLVMDTGSYLHSLTS